MFGNPEAVSFVYGVGGAVFILALLIGFGRTAVRLRIPPKDYPDGRRPQLLVRDVVVIGGFALSATALVLLRFLPIETRVALTSGNVLWALVTTVPICIAAITYVYFEFAVIGRRR